MPASVTNGASKRRRQTTLTLCEELLAAYRRHPRKHAIVAREVGCDRRTAKRIWDGGAELLGVRPLSLTVLEENDRGVREYEFPREVLGDAVADLQKACTVVVSRAAAMLAGLTIADAPSVERQGRVLEQAAVLNRLVQQTVAAAVDLQQLLKPEGTPPT